MPDTPTSPSTEWQAGYRAGVEAAVKAIRDDQYDLYVRRGSIEEFEEFVRRLLDNPPVAPARGERKLSELEEANAKIEGLESELDYALGVLIRRINGEADLASAAEWLRMNFPKRAGEIKQTPTDPPAFEPTHVTPSGLKVRLTQRGFEGGFVLNENGDWSSWSFEKLNDALNAGFFIPLNGKVGEAR